MVILAFNLPNVSTRCWNMAVGIYSHFDTTGTPGTDVGIQAQMHLLVFMGVS